MQYRETDFAFFSRLCEDEGIYYYFTHEEGKHTLVLSDSTAGYSDSQDASAAFGTAQQGMEEVITSWDPSHSFQSGKWELIDFDFEAPNAPVKGTTATVLDNAAFKKWERFDYPGGFVKAADGATLSRLRMEADEAAYCVVEGESGFRAFAPGQKFTLKDHPVAAEKNRKYVLHTVRHEAQDFSHLGNQAAPPFYANRFSCLPDTVKFRPPPATPRPIVHGPQTAIVTGPSGEEIHVDKYGRIKVQFHWDRLGKKDDKTTCFVRVAQMMAGKNWGAVFTPRIGMEVVVEFLEGDPDRPLVVGAVYNATNMPPYGLPANKTQSGIKTRSSKQGDAAAFNELRFEDKKGSEEVYLHAQKDFKRKVENDDTLEVDHDQKITVTNDRSLTVEKGHETIKIDAGNRTTTIAKGDETLTVSKGSRTVTVGEGNDVHTVSKGDRTVTVDKGNDTHTVGAGDRVVNVDKGNDTLTVKMGDETVNVKKGNYSLKLGLGDVTVKADAGKVTIQAMQSIELKVGANSIKIDNTGVTIKGTMVKAQASAMCEVKGAITQVKGDGVVKVQGGMVMIN